MFSMKKNQRLMAGLLSPVVPCSPVLKGQLSPVIAYSPIMKGQLSPSPPPAPKKGESGVFGKLKRSSAPQHVAMRLQDSIELYKRLYGKRSGIPRYQEPIGQCEPIKRKRFGGFFMSKLKKMFVKLCKTGKGKSAKITREEVMENEFIGDNSYIIDSFIDDIDGFGYQADTEEDSDVDSVAFTIDGSSAVAFAPVIGATTAEDFSDISFSLEDVKVGSAAYDIMKLCNECFFGRVYI